MGIIVKSNVRLGIYDLEGNLIDTRESKNLVVNSGLQLCRDLLGGTGYRPDQIQVGTDSTTTTAVMTALQTSVYTKDIDRRVQQTYGIEFQALLESSEANGYTLAEIGTFQQGNMLARAVISPTIAKTSSIQITLSHVITFQAA